MPFLRLTKSFGRLSDPELILMAAGIHRQMNEHTDVFPAPEPTMPELLQATNAFSAAVASLAEGGSRSQFHQKNILKAVLVDELYNLSCYVLFKAKGDQNIALRSGFSIAKEGEAVTLQKPDIPKIAIGNQPGFMDFTGSKVYGAKAYLYQYSTDPGPSEDNWVTVTATTANCTLKGLRVGTTYFFRLGVVGGNQQTMYSAVTSRMAA